MKKRLVLWFVMLMLVSTTLLAACSGNSQNHNNEPGNGSPSSGETNTGQETEPAPSQAADADDMSQKLTIRLSSTGWLNLPRGADDPMNKWINETFNVDFKFSNVPPDDFEKKLTLDFSSNESPDLILFPNKSSLTKFYNEGVLIDDWTPYIDNVSAIIDLFNDNSMEFASKDGKMIGLPKAPRGYSWSFMIRKDWLANLGLSMPTNDQELLDVIRKFTFDDPDRNGKNDTWGISSAGQGKGLGSIYVLANMYGPAGFYLDDQGKANHSILDGNHNKFLDFLKTLVDEKLIDPDWYTQGVTQRKPKVFSGAYGIDWDDVGDFFFSLREFTEYKAEPMDLWELMPIPVAGNNGGNRPARDIASGIYTVSKKAAEDPVKLSRIMKILNAVTYPNDGYFKLRWGAGLMPGHELVEFGDNMKFCTNNCIGSMDPGWIDWGSWIAVDDRTTSLPELTDNVKKEMIIMDAANSQPTNQNIAQMVNFDPQNISDANQVQSQFEINYIMGNDMDYEAFKTRWLQQGGQAMLNYLTEKLVQK